MISSSPSYITVRTFKRSNSIGSRKRERNEGVSAGSKIEILRGDRASLISRDRYLSGIQPEALSTKLLQLLIQLNRDSAACQLTKSDSGADKKQAGGDTEVFRREAR